MRSEASGDERLMAAFKPGGCGTTSAWGGENGTRVLDEEGVRVVFYPSEFAGP